MPQPHQLVEDTSGDKPWWEENDRAEEAYALLRTKSPTEILNTLRVALRVGEYNVNVDFSLEWIVAAGFNMLEERDPSLYRTVVLLGARDVNATVQDMCADWLGINLARAADREVEQLFVSLLSHHSPPVRQKSFEALYRSLHRVPRPIEDALELARLIAPYVDQLPPQ